MSRRTAGGSARSPRGAHGDAFYRELFHNLERRARSLPTSPARTVRQFSTCVRCGGMQWLDADIHGTLLLCTRCRHEDERAHENRERDARMEWDEDALLIPLLAVIFLVTLALMGGCAYAIYLSLR